MDGIDRRARNTFAYGGYEAVCEIKTIRRYIETMSLKARKCPTARLGFTARERSVTACLTPPSIIFAWWRCSSLGRSSWHDVFDVYAIGEFDQTHFYVVGLCQITGSGHHAFQPRKIGSDQRRVVTGR
jgi:hypothetical protein